MKKLVLAALLLGAGRPASAQMYMRREPLSEMKPVPKSELELQELAKTGVSLIVDASTTSNGALSALAEIVNARSGHLTITNAQYKANWELVAIAKKYPHSITLDFRE